MTCNPAPTQRSSGLTLVSAIVLAACAASSHAVTVGRNTGGSTPHLPDFNAGYAKQAHVIGYGNMQPHRTFIETLPARCAAPNERPHSATFSITVRKLTTLARDAHRTQLKFWDRGIEHFSTQIWSPNEPVGSVKTLNYSVNQLPPVGGRVRMNDGWGMALLADRDFSFSVNDDAGVISARLHYQCAPRAGALVGAQNQVGSSPNYPPAVTAFNNVNGNSTGGGIDATGRITFRTSYGIGPHLKLSVPCPRPNTAFGRGAIPNVPLVNQLQRWADAQCTNRGAPGGFVSMRFDACTSDGPGPDRGYHAPVQVTCAR
jgi:hypothetical protein